MRSGQTDSASTASRSRLPQPRRGVRRGQALARRAFRQLARDLVDRRGSGVLVLCGPAERELARQIVATGRRRRRCVSLADDAAVAGPDQGLRPPCEPAGHDRQRPAPLRRRLRPAGGHAVRPDAHRLDRNVFTRRPSTCRRRCDCGPCQRRVCPLDHRCMKLLTPEKVFQAADQLLSRFPGPALVIAWRRQVESAGGRRLSWRGYRSIRSTNDF